MNADRLLEVYENISEAPDAISRLRRFVLDLAVRGKLVEQDAGDEPASELLARVAENRKRLIRAGEIKNPKPLDTIEAPISVPNGWERKRLGELLFLMKNGINTKTTRLAAEFKITRIETISFETIDLTRVGHLDAADDATIEKHQVLLGDILFSHINSEAHLGKTAICESYDPSLLHGVNLLLLRAMPEINPKFLNLTLRQLRASGFFVSISQRAVNQSSINQKNLSQTPIAVPPLAEQQRIVAKVDELMALCDRLEEARKTREETRDKLTAASLARLTVPDTTPEDFPAHAAFALEALPALTTRPDQIKTLRQTILNLAVRGQLPFDHETHSGEANASELAAAYEKPYEIHSTWFWAMMDELVHFQGGSQPPKSTFIYEPREGYTRLVQIRDFKSDANLTFVPNEKANRPFNETDVMIGRYGPPVFQILRGLSGTYNVALMKASPKSTDLSNDFLFLLLQESRIHDEVVAESQRTAGQTGVRLPLLRSFLVGVPPLAEQHRIVAKVDALMALCDRLEAALSSTDTTRTRLLEALLQEAPEPKATSVEAAE